MHNRALHEHLVALRVESIGAVGRAAHRLTIEKVAENFWRSEAITLHGAAAYPDADDHAIAGLAFRTDEITLYVVRETGFRREDGMGLQPGRNNWSLS